MRCPACDYLNFPGADHCDQCMRSLMYANVPQPTKEKLKQMIMTEPVFNVIKKADPVVLRSSDSVKTALKTFQSVPQDCLLIVENDKLVGILTYRDILLKVAGFYKDLRKVPVSKVMTVNPVTLKKTDTVAYAINRMSIGGYRHIPIVDENQRPVDYISVKAVLRHLSDISRTKSSSKGN